MTDNQNNSFIGTKTTSLIVAGLVSGLSLVGCQTSPNSMYQTHSTHQVIEKDGEALKKEVNDTLNSMMKRSFAYDSQITISNANTRYDLQSSLSDLKSGKVDSIDLPEDYCEDIHDESYANVLVQSDKLMLSPSTVDEQLESIKDDYLACLETYHSGKALLEDEDDYLPSAWQQPYSSYTRIQDQAKGKALVNGYFFKRFEGSVRGEYKPLSGFITMRPQLSYDYNNFNISINQPIYIDVTQGDIYVWADNLAMFMTQNVDPKLGLDWKNKWLKISLADGSVPDNFSRDFVKVHIDAAKLVQQSADSENFSYVDLNVSDVSSLTTNIDKEVVLNDEQLKNADYIIELKLTDDDVRRSNELFYQHIYNTLSAKYPELTNFDEQNTDESFELNVKFLISNYLKFIKALERLEQSVDDYNVNDYEDPDFNIVVSDKNTTVSGLEQYGYDKSGNLLWSRYQVLMPQVDKGVYSSDSTSNTVTGFTRYSPVGSTKPAFADIPKDLRTPSESNTVDLTDYSDNLIQRYKAGENLPLLRMMMPAFGINNSIYTQMPADSSE